MKTPLKELADQLILVAKGFGPDHFHEEAMLREYQYKPGKSIDDIWKLAENCLTQENEHRYLVHRLPSIIEPSSKWKRYLSDWK